MCPIRGRVRRVIRPEQDAVGVLEEETARGVRLAAQFRNAGGNIHEKIGTAVEQPPHPGQILRITPHMRADERRVRVPRHQPGKRLDQHRERRKRRTGELRFGVGAQFFPPLVVFVEGKGLAGMFIGDHVSAWGAAADLSAQRHIIWVDKPFQKVLSCAPPMYDELWTAGKAMYKLEPALAEGGELTIYAPHLDTVSHVHGKYIYEIGYHVLPYFLQQWDKFKHIPLGVLAHSTHGRGDGWFENGIEYPRARVALATQLPPEDCARLALGYKNPAGIDFNEWQNREAEGVLYVPKAGEMLYRVKR